MYGEISLLTCSSFLKDRMIKKGIHKLEDLLYQNPDDLHKNLKISKNQLLELQEECQKLISTPAPKSLPLLCVATHDPELNIKLKGGIKTSGIYELVGFPGSGRSKFAKNMCMSWTQQFEDSQVYYLDTDGGINIHNFQSICSDFSRKVLVCRVTTEKQILHFFKNFCNIVKPNSLVVVDSFSSIFKENWNNERFKSKTMVKLGMEMNKNVHLMNSVLMLISGINSQKEPFFGESWGSIITKRFFFTNVGTSYLVDL